MMISKQNKNRSHAHNNSFSEKGRSLFFQPKLTINQPNDIYEQEADAMAEKIMQTDDTNAPQAKFFQPRVSHAQRKCSHCEDEEKKLSRKAANGGEVAAEAGFENYVTSLSNGQSLPAEVRSFYESRIGYDFSQVKVHTDSVAAKSAESINALAYTSGNNIVFNSGQYSPESPHGKRLLAHELTHVAQQNNTSQVFRELDPSMCATDCTDPDHRDGPKGKYTIDVYADKEGPFLLIKFTGNVGHSWVRLTNQNGHVWTYGFWPQEGFDEDNPTADVKGCVHHPDHAHEPTASQTFELTEAEFLAARAKAIAICNDKPKYNLFGLQCTTFVRAVLEGANKVPAGGFGLFWDSPNALASWLKSNSFLLGLKYTHTFGEEAGGWSGEALYRAQFYSLLGNKLRLQGMAGVELGSAKTVTAGVGIEVNPQRIYLPSAYVYGAGSAGWFGGPSGDPGAGVKAGAGLNYNIDEIGFVKVEYSIAKDLVTKDPELKQLSVAAGFKF